MRDLMAHLSWAVVAVTFALVLAGLAVRRGGRPRIGEGLVWVGLVGAAVWAVARIAEAVALIGG